MRTLHTITHEPIHSGSLLSSSARTRHVVTNLSLHEFDDCLTSTYPALETPSLSDCFSHLPELLVRLERQLFPNAVRTAYSHTNYIKKFIRKIISTSTINDRQNFSFILPFYAEISQLCEYVSMHVYFNVISMGDQSDIFSVKIKRIEFYSIIKN